jgi:hypothetical protein
MAELALRDTLAGKIDVVAAAELLPHHRRDALLMLVPEADILDVAVAIAGDEAEEVEGLLTDKKLYKPSLGQLADWCVDLELRFQYVILQPYVLAQVIERPAAVLS